MTKPHKTEVVSVRLPPDLKEAIDALREQDNRSISNYIEFVLQEHVRAKAPKLLKPKK